MRRRRRKSRATKAGKVSQRAGQRGCAEGKAEQKRSLNVRSFVYLVWRKYTSTFKRLLWMQVNHYHCLNLLSATSILLFTWAWCHWQGQTDKGCDILLKLEATGNRRSCRKAWEVADNRPMSTQVAHQSVDINFMSRSCLEGDRCWRGAFHDLCVCRTGGSE